MYINVRLSVHNKLIRGGLAPQPTGFKGSAANMMVPDTTGQPRGFRTMLAAQKGTYKTLSTQLKYCGQLL